MITSNTAIVGNKHRVCFCLLKKLTGWYDRTIQTNKWRQKSKVGALSPTSLSFLFPDNWLPEICSWDQGEKTQTPTSLNERPTSRWNKNKKRQNGSLTMKCKQYRKTAARKSRLQKARTALMHKMCKSKPPDRSSIPAGIIQHSALVRSIGLSFKYEETDWVPALLPVPAWGALPLLFQFGQGSSNNGEEGVGTSAITWEQGEHTGSSTRERSRRHTPSLSSLRIRPDQWINPSTLPLDSGNKIQRWSCSKEL